MSQKEKEEFNKTETKTLKNELNNEIRELIEDTTKEIADVDPRDLVEIRELNRRIKAFKNIRNAINSSEAKSPDELQKIFDDGLYTVLQWRALRKENRTLRRYKRMIEKNMKKYRKIKRKLNNLPPSGQDRMKKNLLENKEEIEKYIMYIKSLEQEQAGNIIELQKNLNKMVTEYSVSPREDFLATTSATSATSDDGFSSGDESLSSPRKPATTRRSPRKATATTRRSPRKPSPRRNEGTKRKQPNEPPPQAYESQQIKASNKYLKIDNKPDETLKKRRTKPRRRVRLPGPNLPKVPFESPLPPANIFRTKQTKPPKSPRHHKVAPPPPPDDGDFADVESNDEEDDNSSQHTSIRVTRKKLPSIPSSRRFQRTRTIHIKPKKIAPIKKQKSKPELVTPGKNKILVKPGPNSSSGIKAVKRRRKKKKGGRRTRKCSK